MAKIQFKYQPPANVVPGSARAEPTPEPVDPTPSLDEAGKKIDRWWYESSWDLRRGLDVLDEDTTIPGELLDELPLPPPGKRRR